SERHAERMGDGDTVPSGLASNVGVLRKLIVELRLGRRHLAAAKRNTIEHSDNALGHRTQVVQHGRPEAYGPERLAVVLEQLTTAGRHEERMKAGHTSVALHLRETGAEVAIGGHGPRSARYHEGRSHGEYRASVEFEARHRSLLLPGDCEPRRHGRPRLR